MQQRFTSPPCGHEEDERTQHFSVKELQLAGQPVFMPVNAGLVPQVRLPATAKAAWSPGVTTRPCPAVPLDFRDGHWRAARTRSRTRCGSAAEPPSTATSPSNSMDKDSHGHRWQAARAFAASMAVPATSPAAGLFMASPAVIPAVPSTACVSVTPNAVDSKATRPAETTALQAPREASPSREAEAHGQTVAVAPPVWHAQEIPSSPRTCPPLLIWRCRDANGFFSMFSVALGYIAVREQQGQAVIIDWSSKDLLYRGPEGEPNLWNAFFWQPAEVSIPRETLLQALRTGQYAETEKYSPVFGMLKGVVQGYGFINEKLAEQGRALCARHIVLRSEFEQSLRRMMWKLLKGSYTWLAVHVRRGDKACEAAANFDLTEDAIASRIILQCNAWRCNAVFLCTDDAAMKKRLKAHLSADLAQGGPGLRVSVYPSLLSSNGQAVHLDRNTDGFQKAEDIVMETLLMARGCSGLLSTLSNVSAAAVYLSPPGYLFTTFWEPVVPLHVPFGIRASCRRPTRVQVLPVDAVGA